VGGLVLQLYGTSYVVRSALLAIVLIIYGHHTIVWAVPHPLILTTVTIIAGHSSAENFTILSQSPVLKH